ncbi:hypothetical protein IZY60_14945 [Lutibacter sp. B2]|nr:hypothetical protein [Lutibacter sp. B2]
MINDLEHIKAVGLVNETKNSDEFGDLSPSQIVPILADRGIYIASESTNCRILEKRRC